MSLVFISFPHRRRLLSPPHLTLYTHHLTQCVDDLHEIALCCHHRIDRLVRRWRLIDHLGVLATLHVGGRALVILDTDALARLRTTHHTTCSMAAAMETFRVAEATHDEAL